MKGLLLAVLPALILLALSTSYNEVSALKCYVKDGAQIPQTQGTCEGHDVVCLSYINPYTVVHYEVATFKTCGERSKVISDCERKALGAYEACKVCETDLCNNEKEHPNDGPYPMPGK